jgi:TatD DNase family protein
MNNLIDFHFHLDYYENYIEKYKYINESMIYVLCMTNMPELYANNINMFETTKYIKFALGFNPQLASSEQFNKKLFNQYLDSTKYIGEVGLDYSKNYVNSKEKQKDIFEYICSAVSDKNKILSIHSRNSEEDVLNILVKNDIKLAVFHWYTGNVKMLDKIINKGYYFSINYAMTKSKKGISIIERIPLDKILVESDGPFIKIGGKVAGPENLYLTYKRLNEILSINSEEVINSNFKNLLYQSIKY